MDDRTIAALFVADRIDHLTNERDGILDLIARGFDVISDRYHLSSIAYHSSDVSSDWISGSNELSTDLLRPDLTIYLDISPRTALERLQARTGLSDKFEVLDRLEHAHRAYAEAILDLEKLDNIHLITALGSPDEVLVRVLELMNSTWP